jgi:NADH:ubiquinone oxidoreductase subunit H
LNGFKRALYYIGRFAQLVGMWMLLVDLFTAGPLGPNPRLFATGVVVFLIGWAITRTVGR